MWNRGNTKGIFNKIISYLDSTFSDHGIFRIFWRSWARLPGNMYRSNQPYPYQIKRDIKKHQIKSIINLRGERHCSSFYLEKDFCLENNIKLYNFPISSRDLPDKVKLIAFNNLLNEIKYPCIMHCKSGADRVGIAAALYLVFKQNYTIEKAQKQLSLKHLHIKYAKTGILDYFFKEALKSNVANKAELLEWIKNEYNKNKLKKDFKTISFFNIVVDRILKRE